jgi:hypothetical protein
MDEHELLDNIHQFSGVDNLFLIKETWLKAADFQSPLLLQLSLPRQF